MIEMSAASTINLMTIVVFARFMKDLMALMSVVCLKGLGIECNV